MATKHCYRTLVLLLLFFATGLTYAQPDNKKQNNLNYAAYPYWIQMLNDTNANYFEVQKAFELFWKGKELPAGEDEIIGESRKLKNNLLNRVFNARELKEQQELEAYSFDCKKYRWWLIKMEPFVQDAGNILSPSRRLELWKKHYEELEEQSNH